jgi:nitrate reductase alpha subunit
MTRADNDIYPNIASILSEAAQIGAAQMVMSAKLIPDTATMQSAPIAVLPGSLVSECHIAAAADGHALPFEKDSTCSRTFYTSLGPLLGKLMPAANAKRCTVLVDGVEILKNNSCYRRRA